MTNDPYNLQRFVDAQEPQMSEVLSELEEGDKHGHWMWFVFPQIEGLGASSLSRKFAISSSEEAGAYLEHPILGPRLRNCVQLLTQVQGRSIDEILGVLDAMKFKSSLTLFVSVAKDKQIFLDALKKFYNGEFDPLTIKLL